MTEPGDEFDTFLKTRTLLPNGMSDHDDKLEPPKALDAIVLKEAREAIRARQQPSRAPRWATPVALAATILLCLSILLNVSLNTNRPASNLQRMAAATAEKASPPSASPVPEDQRTEGASRASSSNEVILPEAKIAEQRASRLVAQTAAPAPSAAPPPDSSAADRADALANRSGTPMQALREATPRANSPAANSAASRAPQVADRASTAAQAQSEPQSGANAGSDGAPQLADRASTAARAQSETQSGATAGADSVTALAARGSMVSPSATRDPAAAPPTIEGGAQVQGRDQPALARMAQAKMAQAKPKAAVATPRHTQDPKTWLQQIADLRAEGKTEQAEAEMRRFRAAFPAYSVKPAPAAPSEPPK